MYISITGVIAVVTAFTLTSVSIAPAEETFVSNIPFVFDEEMNAEEARKAKKAFFVCEYSEEGYSAMSDIITTFGKYSLEGDDLKRSEAAYKAANKYIEKDICHFDGSVRPIYGRLHNTEDHDFSVANCAPLTNGACVAIQSVFDGHSEEIMPMYILVEDEDILSTEKIGGGNGMKNQWRLVN